MLWCELGPHLIAPEGLRSQGVRSVQTGGAMKWICRIIDSIYWGYTWESDVLPGKTNYWAISTPKLGAL